MTFSLRPHHLAPIPKPSRIEDPAAVDKARLDWCEWCWWQDTHVPARIQVHHARSKGARGDDAAPNLVSLCFRCHVPRWHQGLIDPEEFFLFLEHRNLYLPLRDAKGRLACRYCGRWGRPRWSRETWELCCGQCGAALPPPPWGVLRG